MSVPFTYNALRDGAALALDASAGTGKTHTLTNIALRLVADGHVALEKLLIVTFTNAATAELKLRLLATLRQARQQIDGQDTTLDDETKTWLTKTDTETAVSRRQRIDQAIQHFDDASIVTIHGFCQRMIGYVGASAGLNVDAVVTDDDTQALTALLDDLTQTVIGARTVTQTAFLTGACRLSREHIDRLARQVLQVSELRLVDNTYRDTPCGTVADVHHTLDTIFDVWRDTFAEAKKQFDMHAPQIAEHVTELLDDPYFASNTRQRTYTPKQAGVVTESFASFFARPHDVPAIAIAKKRAVQPDAPYAFFTFPAMQDAGLFGTPPAHWLIEISTALAAARHHVITQARNLIARSIKSQYVANRTSRNVLTYDDLLTRLYTALTDDNRAALTRQMVKSQYQMALIDEFQDTDMVQWGIFQQLFTPADPLIVIGDPKQAIYQFRGADVTTYLRARDTMGHVYTLDTNWRSDDAHVNAVNAVFHETGAFDPYAITFTKSVATRPNRLTGSDIASGINVRTVPVNNDTTGAHQTRIIDDVAAHAVTILHSTTLDTAEGTRAITPRDIAVLVRTNRRARQVRQALVARGIPAAIQRGGSVFHTADAAALHQLLAAINRPHDVAVARGAAAGELIRMPAATLAALEDETATPAQTAQFDTFITQLVAWQELWQRHGVFACIMAAQGAFVPHNTSERTLINIRHLAELLEAAAHQHDLGPDGLLAFFATQRAEVDDPLYKTTDADELRLDAGDNAVTIATVHSAKGLEYPVVFTIDLWMPAPKLATGVVSFTDPAATPHPKPALDLAIYPPYTSELESHQHALRDRAAEQVRLAYVALTRARHATVVWVPDGERDATSPLGAVMQNVDAAITFTDVFDTIARDTGAAITTVATDTPHTQMFTAQTPDVSTLTTRLLTRTRFDTFHRHTSFSALTRHNDSHATTVALSRPAGDDDRDDTLNFGPSLSQALPLASFPRGTAAGNLLHSVFEQLDFVDANPATVTETLTTHAQQTRFVGLPVAEAVTGILAAIDTPLGDTFGDIALRNLTRDDRADEMPFTLPLATKQATVTLASLAPLLRQSRDVLLNRLAERLENDRFHTPLAGFLTGSIDALVRLHDGRYAVIDYKSNFVADVTGDTHQACYAPDMLTHTMTEHLYTLQALLYLVATHRYLAGRIDNYTPETHLAGAGYLFLRGMTGLDTPKQDDGQRYGVATVTVEPEILHAINQLLAAS